MQPVEDDDEDDIPLSAWALRSELEFFYGSMTALLDVLESTLPHTRKRDTLPALLSQVSRKLPGIPVEAKRKIFDLLEASAASGSLDSSTFLSGLTDYVDEDWGMDLWLAFRRALNGTRREPVLLASLLTTAVADFEALISNVVEVYFTTQPQALEALPKEQQKEFSLKEIRDLGSVDAVVEAAVHRRVYALMYGGGLAKWNKFFKDSMNLDMAQMQDGWVELLEVFERRNAIAHNGGYASQRYVDFAARSEGIDQIDLGGGLFPDEAYVREAVERLLSLGTILATAASLKLAQDNPIASLELMFAVSNHVEEKRYMCASKVAHYADTVLTASGDERHFRQVEIQALNRLGRTHEVSAALEELDPSGDDPRFDELRAAIASDSVLVHPRTGVAHRPECRRKGGAVPLHSLPAIPESLRACRLCEPDAAI